MVMVFTNSIQSIQRDSRIHQTLSRFMSLNGKRIPYLDGSGEGEGGYFSHN